MAADEEIMEAELAEAFPDSEEASAVPNLNAFTVPLCLSVLALTFFSLWVLWDIGRQKRWRKMQFMILAFLTLYRLLNGLTEVSIFVHQLSYFHPMILVMKTLHELLIGLTISFGITQYIKLKSVTSTSRMLSACSSGFASLISFVMMGIGVTLIFKSVDAMVRPNFLLKILFKDIFVPLFISSVAGHLLYKAAKNVSFHFSQEEIQMTKTILSMLCLIVLQAVMLLINHVAHVLLIHFRVHHEFWWDFLAFLSISLSRSLNIMIPVAYLVFLRFPDSHIGHSAFKAINNPALERLSATGSRNSSSSPVAATFNTDQETIILTEDV